MNCGAVYSHGENAFDFTVSNFADNKNKMEHKKMNLCSQ